MLSVVAQAQVKAPDPNAARLKVTVQGYEVAHQDVGPLLTTLPPKIDTKAFLLQVASFAGQGRAKIVKMGALDTTSGARGTAQEGDFRIEARCVLGGDKSSVDLIVALNEGAKSLATGAKTQLGGALFLGAWDGSAADKVILVFVRVSQP